MDPELKKYLWVVIRTQKERKLQTLIEVCTDFSSLVSPTHLHRPAEQTFTVHQQADSYTEEVEDQEDVFAWATVHHGIEDLRMHPCLPAYNRCSHWRVAWDMRCIRSPDNRMLSVDLRGIVPPDQNRGFRPPARIGGDYSRIKCFSCGEFGHMQSRCQMDGTSNLASS